MPTPASDTYLKQMLDKQVVINTTASESSEAKIQGVLKQIMDDCLIVDRGYLCLVFRKAVVSIYEVEV